MVREALSGTESGDCMSQRSQLECAWGQGILGRGTSEGQGPEAGASWACSRSREVGRSREVNSASMLALPRGHGKRMGFKGGGTALIFAKVLTLSQGHHQGSNLLASRGHTGRRRVVLGHMLTTQTRTKTDEEKKVLSKFTTLCWAAFTAILGHGLDTHGTCKTRNTCYTHSHS